LIKRVTDCCIIYELFNISQQCVVSIINEDKWMLRIWFAWSTRKWHWNLSVYRDVLM